MTEQTKQEFTGGLCGSYPPRRRITMTKETKVDERLSEEIEVEEVYDDSTPEAKDAFADACIDYNLRKETCANNILGELAGFLKKPANEWSYAKEGTMLTDIVSLVDNAIKAQLSANKQNCKG